MRLLCNKQCTANSLTAAVGRLSSTSILLALPCLSSRGNQPASPGSDRAADTLTTCCRRLQAPERDGSGLSQEGSGGSGVSLASPSEQSTLARHGSPLASQPSLAPHGSTVIPVHSALARQGSVAAEDWDGQAQAGREGISARRNRLATTSLEDKEEQGDRRNRHASISMEDKEEQGDRCAHLLWWLSIMAVCEVSYAGARCCEHS